MIDASREDKPVILVLTEVHRLMYPADDLYHSSMAQDEAKAGARLQESAKRKKTRVKNIME